MVRRHAPTPPDVDPDELADTEARVDDRPTDATDVRDLPDLSSLPIAGLTRRRLAGLLGTMVAIWIVVVFARPVGDASAAAARVDQMHVDNAVLSTEVEALTRELDQIKRQRFIEQEARAHGLGSSKEIAFTLAEDAPRLPDDAPGSASVRLGARASEVTPLDRWLTLLFGPGD
jgi:cell division protein FtsB